MRKMKDSGIPWSGEIPARWNLKKLKDLFHFEKGKNAQTYTKEYIGANEGSFPVYSGQTENNGIMGKISSFDYDVEQCIFTTTVGAKVMSARILTGKFSLSQNCLIMQPKSNLSQLKFIYYVLTVLFEYEKSLIPAYMQPSLRISDLSTYCFYIPDLSEQQRITDFLDAKCARIDEAAELVRQSIEKLRAYKLSLITEAVTKGLDPDVPMKDSGIPWIGEIPEKWGVVRLKFIAPLQCGYAFKADRFSTDCGVPLVRMSNLKRGKLDLEEAVKIQEEDIVEDFFLKEHDILLGLSGSLGDTGSLGNYAIVSKTDLPCLLNQRVGRFIISNKILPNFLIYIIATEFFKRPLELVSTGTAQFNISPTAIGEVFVPLLPLSEQQRIADYLDAKCARIDTLLEEKERLLDRLAEYKKSLIFECVTGKREVSA